LVFVERQNILQGKTNTSSRKSTKGLILANSSVTKVAEEFSISDHYHHTHHMKNLLINIFLFLVAIGLLILISPFGLIGTLITSIDKELQARKSQNLKNEGIKYATESMLTNGLSLDIFGNVINKDFLNHLLLKRSSINPTKAEHVAAILFGNPRMSISGVIGLNAELNTLNWIGIILGKFLNLLDTDHIEKAADNNRKYI
jgi:hypothetical protein